MILSYHPCFAADKNLICAGREPDKNDIAAIQAADAVILPQGCRRSLYQMARKNCRHVFPNFDARFAYPGKIGQVRLFRKINAPHPATEPFDNLGVFYRRYGRAALQPSLGFPLVFKFDWGGEGQHVYLLNTAKDLREKLQLAEYYENIGHSGFLVQEHIPSGNRALRVVVVGQTIFPYWRIQNRAQNFCSNISRGALVDTSADPDLQLAATAAVKEFCSHTDINLAGFDILFLSKARPQKPLLLEINYFFGRRGLGGSERFYELLNTEIEKWLEGISLSP